MPSLARRIVPELVRRKMKRDLQGQGIGRFSEEELLELAKRDINALAEFLGDREFFSGDKPGELDCSAYGMLANIYHVPSKKEFEDYADTLGNLKDYTRRMSEKVFPVFPLKLEKDLEVVKFPKEALGAVLKHLKTASNASVNIYPGKDEEPIKCSSIDLAAVRPSWIAQTTSEAPLVQSPVAKTPSMLVWQPSPLTEITCWSGE